MIYLKSYVILNKTEKNKFGDDMKSFCFTVDDNIRFLKEITETKPKSIFTHPYLAMYKRLHERYGLCVQLNLFYRMDGFDLSEMTDRYIDEWESNSDWLKLSFHSDYENEKPYEFSDYDEVFSDCKRVNEQIVRFASARALAKTTTVHYCLTTENGLKALLDNGVKGLLGLFGDDENPCTSYSLDAQSAKTIRNGAVYRTENMSFASIDIVLNCFSIDDILSRLDGLKKRDSVRVMIHEQYFYPDYVAYQKEFEEKLSKTFDFLTNNAYKSNFFEDLI